MKRLDTCIFSEFLPLRVSFKAVACKLPHEIWSKKLESLSYHELIDGENRVILYVHFLHVVPACDRQTDLRTDGPLIAKMRYVYLWYVARQKNNIEN